jgi:hypothetical protein
MNSLEEARRIAEVWRLNDVRNKLLKQVDDPKQE